MANIANAEEFIVTGNRREFRLNEAVIFTLDTTILEGSPLSSPAPTVSINEITEDGERVAAPAGMTTGLLVTIADNLIHFGPVTMTESGQFELTIQFHNAKWKPARELVVFDVKSEYE